jgi:hypothetical protein
VATEPFPQPGVQRVPVACRVVLVDDPLGLGHHGAHPRAQVEVHVGRDGGEAVGEHLLPAAAVG